MQHNVPHGMIMEVDQLWMCRRTVIQVRQLLMAKRIFLFEYKTLRKGKSIWSSKWRTEADSNWEWEEEYGALHMEQIYGILQPPYGISGFQLLWKGYKTIAHALESESL